MSTIRCADYVLLPARFIRRAEPLYRPVGNPARDMGVAAFAPEFERGAGR